MTSPQSGFTLIELLVSTIVLSIGLLGLAQLEIFSMRHSHGSYLRSQATHLAQDIADRMRANPGSVDNGVYTRLMLESGGDGGRGARVHNCSDPGVGCSSIEMAQNDIWDWRSDLPRILPSGQGVVCLDSTPQDGTRWGAHGCDDTGTLYAIKIWWDEDRDGGTNLRRFVTSFRP